MDAIKYVQIMQGIQKRLGDRKDFSFDSKANRIVVDGKGYTLSDFGFSEDISLKDIMRCTERILSYVNPQSDDVEVSATWFGLVVSSKTESQRVYFHEIARVLGVSHSPLCTNQANIRYSTAHRVESYDGLISELRSAGFQEAGRISRSQNRLTLYVHNKLSTVVILPSCDSSTGFVLAGRGNTEFKPGSSWFSWRENTLDGDARKHLCFYHSIYNGFSLDLSTAYQYYSRSGENWSEPLSWDALDVLMSHNYFSYAFKLYKKEKVLQEALSGYLKAYICSCEIKLLLEYASSINSRANEVLSPALQRFDDEWSKQDIMYGIPVLKRPSAMLALNRIKKTLKEEYKKG